MDTAEVSMEEITVTTQVKCTRVRKKDYYGKSKDKKNASVIRRTDAKEFPVASSKAIKENSSEQVSFNSNGSFDNELLAIENGEGPSGEQTSLTITLVENDEKVDEHQSEKSFDEDIEILRSCQAVEGEMVEVVQEKLSKSPDEEGEKNCLESPDKVVEPPIERVENPRKKPKELERRLKALRKLQIQNFLLQAEYNKELFNLRREHEKLRSHLYEKRYEIISGKREPSDEDCEFLFDVEGDEEECVLGSEEILGVPHFWLAILKDLPCISSEIQPYDIPVLAYLEDVRVATSETEMTFNIQFHFSPNEYFANTVLAKTYTMQCEVDGKNPLAFTGPTMVGCKATRIQWRIPERNVTVTREKVTLYSKASGARKTILRPKRRPSFFNLFRSEDEIHNEGKLADDFRLGFLLYNSIVPKAVLYFVGEKDAAGRPTVFEEKSLEASEVEAMPDT